MIIQRGVLFFANIEVSWDMVVLMKLIQGFYCNDYVNQEETIANLIKALLYY